MADTPNLGLPLLAAAQSQKHVTHNEALEELDGLVQCSVISRTLTSPPGSPAAGATYIVATGPTGDWAGQAKKIAYYDGSSWVFLTPKEGWRAYDKAQSEMVFYDGSVWARLSPALGKTNNGAVFEFVVEEELLELTGGAIVQSGIDFPNRSIPLFASVYNVDAVTGPAGFQWYTYEFGSVSITFETGFSGNNTLGQQQVGPANPVKPAFTNAKVRFEDYAATAGSGTGTAFTGGDVRLTIGYLKATPANT